MGGIRRENALPRDPTFSQTNNNYDKHFFKIICAELGVDPSTCTDFCLDHVVNHGLGNVFFFFLFREKGMRYLTTLIQGDSKLTDE